MQCYKLVNSRRDKMVAYAKGLLVESFALGMSWAFLIHDPRNVVVQDLWPIMLPFCILVVLFPGPLVLIDELTRSVRITDQDISTVSRINRRGDITIPWESLVRVQVQSSPARASGIEKVVVLGRHKVNGLGGGYWMTRKITIPGHQPDIQRILETLREAVPDKFD